jgi:hypothetical protein
VLRLSVDLILLERLIDGNSAQSSWLHRIKFCALPSVPDNGWWVGVMIGLESNDAGGEVGVSSGRGI